MKRALCATQRHGHLWAIALLTSLFIASCGSQASFTSEKSGQSASGPRTGTTTSGTNSTGSNATAISKPTASANASQDSASTDPVLNTQVIPTFNPLALPTSTPTPTVVPVPVPTSTATATPTPSSTPDPTCTTPPQTVVTRLSNTFKNNALNQYIQYRLSQTDCHNNPIPITVNEIRFDVNARVVTGMANIPFAAYLVSNPTNPLASGALQVVTGRDMFGTVSPTRWYYSTTNQVTIPASTYEIYFALDYSCSVIHTMGSSAPYPATESINSYLAFGDATPNTQALQVSNSQLSGACR